MAVRLHNGNDYEDISFDDSVLTRKRSSHSEGHSDRKLPRLCLDDALIMVASLASSHAQLANLETKESSAARREEEPQAEAKKSSAGKKSRKVKEDDEFEVDSENSSEFDEARSPATRGSKARSSLSSGRVCTL